jgi:hypothetical protein
MTDAFLIYARMGYYIARMQKEVSSCAPPVPLEPLNLGLLAEMPQDQAPKCLSQTGTWLAIPDKESAG